MCKFKVGDKVKVVNNGTTYTLYDFAARELGLKNWNKRNTPDNGLVGTILSTFSDSREIYGIRIDSTGEEYVIGEKGLGIYTGEYNLTLTPEEARTLLVLTGNVIGDMVTSPRKHCDSVYYRLEKMLDMDEWEATDNTPEGKLFSTNNDWGGNYIYFDNYPDLQKQ